MDLQRAHIETSRVLLKTFERRTRGCLGTTREDFKTTQEQLRAPSSLVVDQVLLRTSACRTRGRLGTTCRGYQDYSGNCTRLQSTRGLVVRASLGPPSRWTMPVCGTGYRDYSPCGPRCKTACTTRQDRTSTRIEKLLMYSP